VEKIFPPENQVSSAGIPIHLNIPEFFVLKKTAKASNGGHLERWY